MKIIYPVKENPITTCRPLWLAFSMAKQEAPLGDLDGILVVALEQAVAAPLATARLADAGARVIKVERPEGDFARGYDRHVQGQSTYFVWANRGKQSIALDLRQAADLDVLKRMIARADVFVQNLAPGAAARLGVGPADLCAAHPQAHRITVDGPGGPVEMMGRARCRPGRHAFWPGSRPR